MVELNVVRCITHSDNKDFRGSGDFARFGDEKRGGQPVTRVASGLITVDDWIADGASNTRGGLPALSSCWSTVSSSETASNFV